MTDGDNDDHVTFGVECDAPEIEPLPCCNGGEHDLTVSDMANRDIRVNRYIAYCDSEKHP